MTTEVWLWLVQFTTIVVVGVVLGMLLIAFVVALVEKPETPVTSSWERLVGPEKWPWTKGQ